MNIHAMIIAYVLLGGVAWAFLDAEHVSEFLGMALGGLFVMATFPVWIGRYGAAVWLNRNAA